MDMNQLPLRKGYTKPAKRLGKGSSSGKGVRCGYGNKGAKARSGRGKSIGFEGGQTPFYRRIPKFRGFSSLTPYKCVGVTLQSLNRFFEDGDTVSVELLKEKGLISKKAQSFKVIATGSIEKKLIVKGTASASAKNLLEEQGGKVEGV
jgi:large subunit ribosomal protein L15